MSENKSIKKEIIPMIDEIIKSQFFSHQPEIHFNSPYYCVDMVDTVISRKIYCKKCVKGKFSISKMKKIPCPYCNGQTHSKRWVNNWTVKLIIIKSIDFSFSTSSSHVKIVLILDSGMRRDMDTTKFFTTINEAKKFADKMNRLEKRKKRSN